jgi:hypothetical protein
MGKVKKDSVKIEENAILSVKDLLHLQAAPTVDEKKYVIQKTKVEHTPVVYTANITEEQRQRYFSTGMDSEDSILARKMQDTVKKIETDVTSKKEQAAILEREAMQQAIQEREAMHQKENTPSEFDFGPLITGSVLKSM